MGTMAQIAKKICKMGKKMREIREKPLGWMLC